MAVLEASESDRHRRNERLEQLLGEFGLTALRDSPAMALSGGERRRCEIARALAADPSIMMTSAADTPSSEWMPVGMPRPLSSTVTDPSGLSWIRIRSQ